MSLCNTQCVFFICCSLCVSSGLVTVPAGGGGTFLGGYLVKRFSLNCAAIIKMCIATTALGVVFTLCFFISCPNIAFAGVTRSYGDLENVTATGLLR